MHPGRRNRGLSILLLLRRWGLTTEVAGTTAEGAGAVGEEEGVRARVVEVGVGE